MVWPGEMAEAEVVTEEEQAEAAEQEQAPEQEREQELLAVASSTRAPRSLDSRYHHNPRE